MADLRKIYPRTGDPQTVCGAKFLFNSANHTMDSLSTYPFPLFFEEWGLEKKDVTKAWDNKGDINIGNDVWIGYEAIIFAGVMVGDGVVIGTRAVVTKDVPPYTIVGGVPAEPIKKRFSDERIMVLLPVGVYIQSLGWNPGIAQAQGWKSYICNRREV